MSKSPIKTCVLGVGLSGLTFHIPFILALPDFFELHSVLERNPQSPGGKVKERFGVNVRIHTKFEDILEDGSIELVVVATPNDTHYDFAKRALESGKHVLVDKPVVPSANEARALRDIAKSKGLVLYAYQNCRFNSDFLALRRLLTEPSSSPVCLGDLLDFESHYDRFRDKLKGDWKETNTPGAGQVYNLGSHLIDQAIVLFGRPDNVTGLISNVRRLGDLNVDDSFTIILHYIVNEIRKYPLTVTLRSHPLSTRSPQLRFVVRGVKGTFVKCGMDVQESQLRIMPDPHAVFADSYGREPEEIWGTVEVINDIGNVKTMSWPTTEKGDYSHLFRNLAGAIRTGEPIKIEWDEVITQLEVIELAHASSRLGKTMTM